MRHRSHRPMHQFDHPIDHEHAHTLLRPTKAPHSRVPLAPCRGRRRNSAQRLEGGCFDGVQYLASWRPCIRLIWGRQASVRDRERVVGGGSGRDTTRHRIHLDMGVPASFLRSRTRSTCSRLPWLDPSSDRPLNGTWHRPRTHANSHTPSLNVPLDWLSHRGAHTMTCAPNLLSGRRAGWTMITTA